jgi:hypothetical protein
MEVPPPIRAPSGGTVLVVKDVFRIRDALDVLHAHVLALLENPFMGKYAGLKFHAIVVRLKVAGIVNQFVGKIPPEGIFDTRGKPSCSAGILPAGAIDVNLQRAQIERHVSTPKSKKGTAVSAAPFDLSLS